MDKNTKSKGLWSRIFIAGAIVVVMLIVIFSLFGQTTEDKAENTPVFKVARGPLTIDVTESGTIKAREQVILKSEVEGRTTIIYLMSKINAVDLLLEKVIRWFLSRWTDLTLVDYDKLLAIDRGYSIANLTVKEKDWMCGKTLNELRLNREGILVLGMRRNNKYFGAPSPDSPILAHDILTCYGTDRRLRNLRARKSGSDGDVEHNEAVESFDENKEKQPRR